MSHFNTILDTLKKEDLSLFMLKETYKGEILFFEGDLCEYIGIVLEGELVISSYTFLGKEIIFNNIKKGMMFASNLLFSSDPYFKGNVISLTKSKVYLIDKTNLLTLSLRNKDFLSFFLETQSNNALNLNIRLKLLSFPTLKERFLYNLYLHNNHLEYKSISLLAKELNVERETLSRLIASLKKEGKITKEKGVISLK